MRKLDKYLEFVMNNNEGGKEGVEEMRGINSSIKTSVNKLRSSMPYSRIESQSDNTSDVKQAEVLFNMILPIIDSVDNKQKRLNVINKLKLRLTSYYNEVRKV